MEVFSWDDTGNNTDNKFHVGEDTNSALGKEGLCWF